MRVIVKVNVIIPRKELPGAVARPFGAPMGLHCCERGIELLFVVGIVRGAVSVGEGPEDDGDGPDDVAVLCVYCAGLGVGAAEGVVGGGVEGAEGEAGEGDAGGEAIEGVVERAGASIGRLLWRVVFLAGR